MKHTFKMTPDDYNAILEYRNKKCFGKSKGRQLTAMLAVTVALAAALTFVNWGMCLIVLAAGLASATLFIFSRKLNNRSFYRSSPVALSEHTLLAGSDGMEIINSYEKLFVPWGSVLSIKETKEHLLILPTCIKGAAAINKNQCDGETMNELISVLKQNVKFEGE